MYLRIPENIMPVERGEKYENQLDLALREKGLGSVSGGGTMMSVPDANGKRQIEYVGIDVDLTNFTSGIAFLKSELSRLRVPEGTVLEYTVNGIRHSENLQ